MIRLKALATPSRCHSTAIQERVTVCTYNHTTTEYSKLGSRTTVIWCNLSEFLLVPIVFYAVDLLSGIHPFEGHKEKKRYSHNDDMNETKKWAEAEHPFNMRGEISAITQFPRFQRTFASACECRLAQ